MNSATSVRTANYDTRVPWIDVLLSAVAAVSWALIGMAGTAALGLHLLGADATGSLGPMTAAVVALGAGGSVTPTGDVSAFGLTGAQATTAVTITPLGVSLVGALLLSYFFLRSLRAAGVVIAPAELLARAGSVIALFVAMLGGLAWAGHDVITIDGSKLGLDKLTGGGGSGGGVNIPGLGDIGDIGGLLPGKISDLVKAKAAIGFTVDTAPTLLGGLGWSAGILLIALLASRRTPSPAAGRPSTASYARPRPRSWRYCWSRWRRASRRRRTRRSATTTRNASRARPCWALPTGSGSASRSASSSPGTAGRRANSRSSSPTPLDQLLSVKSISR